MTNRTIPCRVCGKMFVPCNKPSNVIGAFNYHSIACSPECGAEYLRRVQAARQKPNSETASVDAKVSAEEDVVQVMGDEQKPKRTRGKRRDANFVEDAMNIDKKTVEEVMKTED